MLTCQPLEFLPMSLAPGESRAHFCATVIGGGSSLAKVTLVGNLKQFTGGITELDVDAQNVRQLFRALTAEFPELGPHLEDGLAVAIDGQIYQESLLEPINPDSDVHILPQIAGG